MRSVLAFATAFWLSLCLAQPASAQSDAGAHVLALDNSWNRALETNDTKALDMLLADNFVSIDVDGSIQNKREFLASLKSTGYQAPLQAVTNKARWMSMETRRWFWESFARRARRKGSP